MKEDRTVRVTEPHGYPCFELINRAHKGHNEVYHSGRSAWLTIEDYAGVETDKEQARPWLSVRLEEIIPGKNGRQTSRVISVTLSTAERAKLLRMLLSGHGADDAN